MELILIEPPASETFKFRLRAGFLFLRGTTFVAEKDHPSHYETETAALAAFCRARDFNPRLHMRPEVVS